MTNFKQCITVFVLAISLHVLANGQAASRPVFNVVGNVVPAQIQPLAPSTENNRQCAAQAKICAQVIRPAVNGYYFDISVSENGICESLPNTGQFRLQAFSRGITRFELWSNIILLPASENANCNNNKRFILGIIEHGNTVYNGGNTNYTRMRLFEFDMYRGGIRRFFEVADLPWNSHTFYSLCPRPEGEPPYDGPCQIRFEYSAELTLGVGENSWDMPQIEYHANARSNFENALAMLEVWRNAGRAMPRPTEADQRWSILPECSGSKRLSFNRWSYRYEFDDMPPSCMFSTVGRY